MFKLNKDVEYALIGLMALKQDETVSMRNIASAHGIPFEKLSKIFQQLARAGFVKAQYGVHGGYQPLMTPEQISMLDITSALHGELAITPCITKSDNCSRSDTCSIRSGISRLQQRIEDSLKHLTLKELLQ